MASSNTYDFHSISFKRAHTALGIALLRDGHNVRAANWQSIPVADRPQAEVIELLNAVFSVALAPGDVYHRGIEDYIGFLQRQIDPNLPWAEDHFLERVSGLPLNPGEQYKNWPYYRGNVETHRRVGSDEGEQRFSHTYMERFWPKRAPLNEHVPGRHSRKPLVGVRYAYGDLQDVVKMLDQDPTTRQAFLPVWFPEDTGAVHGERVPCTLGYQFMLRQNQLHITYFIRSCDYVRHFRDDVYLAARLCHWVLQELRRQSHDILGRDREMWDAVKPGLLTMFMTSLHIFGPDVKNLEKKFSVYRPQLKS